MQAHFLALCVTLMKESGSLSQEHGRIGSKKNALNIQRYGRKVQIGLGRVQCKLNVPGVFTVGEDCLESYVVQYCSH